MKVTKDRIYEQDLFEPLKKMARESTAKLEKMSAQTKVLSKNLADLAKKYDGTAKSQRLLNEAERESRKIMQDAITLEEKKIKLKTANERLTQAELRTKKMLEDAEKRELKNKKDLNSEYAKQSKRLNDLRKEYKDLILTQGRETEQTRALKKEILALDSTLKKVDATVGQHQRSVGNYERALGGVRNMLGQLGLGFGVFQILRDSFGIITENEDAMASLSAITGLTGDKFEVFKTAINETATELNVSSTEVAQAAEKIASAQPKLLENADALAAVTKEAITLNRAIKGDLTETSLALVGVMNQFGESAEEAASIINILAAGSQAGAASVNQINESIVKFGTTADLMNISIEESVGLIETLGEKAIFGSDAGTALRNILLKMSSIDVLPEKALKQLEKYGVDTNIVKDTTLSFEERLRELSKVSKDSTAIMQIFGTENATAATVLLNNLDTYSKMTDAVTDTNVATEQAAINQDTMSAALDEARAAWENAIIEINSGTGAGEGFKDAIKAITKIIPILVRGIGELLKVLASFLKAITDVVGAVEKLDSSWGSWYDLFKSSYRLLLQFIPGGTKLLEMIDNMGSSTDNLTAAQRRNNIINEQALAQGKEILKQNKEEISDVSVLIDALINKNTTREEEQEIIAKLNQDYPELTKNIDLESASTETLIALKRELIKQILNEAIERKKAEQLALFTDKIIELELQKIGAGESGIKEMDRQIKELYATLPLIEEIANTVKNNVESTVAGLDVSEPFRDINDEISLLNTRLLGLKSELKGPISQQRRDIINKEIEEANKELARLMDVRQKMLDDALDKQGETTGVIDGSITNPSKGAKKAVDDLSVSIDNLTEKSMGSFLKFMEDNNFNIGGIVTFDEDGDVTAEELFSDMEIEAEKFFMSWQDQLKKMVEATRDVFKEVVDMIAELIRINESKLDQQIARQQMIFDGAKDREAELRRIAEERKLNADESIAAERDAQKKALLEIERLEGKKRELEMTIAAMKLLADGKSVANIKNAITDIKSFVKANAEGSFYEGTETTVGAALGHNNKKDGHTVNVDDKEAIFNPAQTAALDIRPGGNTTQDIVDSFQHIQRMADSKFSGASSANSFADNIYSSAILNQLIEMKQELKTLPDNIPQNDLGFNAFTGAFEYERRTKLRREKIRYNIRRR